MKILLINKFHYVKGGAESVYFDTQEVLEKNGHEVIFFSMADERNKPSAQEKYFVPFVDFSSTKNWFSKALRFIYYPRAAKNLEKLIQVEKPDVAHLHNVSHQLTYSILKPLKKHNIPVVQTLHDYQLISPNYHLYDKGQISEVCKKTSYYKCVLHKCVRNSFSFSLLAALEMYIIKWFRWLDSIDLFISPSNFLKDKFQEWGFSRKITVVNNFLKLEQIEPSYEFEDYIVWAGRLSQEKGVMSLVKAVAELPEVNLKLVGDGPQKNEISRYLEVNAIDNIELLGRKPREELFSIMRRAKFMVISSEWYENYPMTIVEAMALGKPVLASRLGGMKEMIIEDHTGWFFNAGDKKSLKREILKYYTYNEKLTQMGKNARVMVEKNNSSSKYYREIMDCYQSVIKNNQKIGLG